MNTGSTSKVREMTITALMAAVICVLGPISVPIGPVPISLTNLAIYFVLYAVGTKRGLSAFLIYLLLGLAGLPVFSGFTGGPQKLFGPTGGYIIGFLGMTLVAGLFIDRFTEKRIRCILGMFLATLIPYVLGTLWLAVSAHMTFKAALAAGVLPFVWEDVLKMAAAAALGPVPAPAGGALLLRIAGGIFSAGRAALRFHSRRLTRCATIIRIEMRKHLVGWYRVKV